MGAGELLSQHLHELVLGGIAWLVNRTVGRLDADLKELQDALPDIQIRIAILEAKHNREEH